MAGWKEKDTPGKGDEKPGRKRRNEERGRNGDRQRKRETGRVEGREKRGERTYAYGSVGICVPGENRRQRENGDAERERERERTTRFHRGEERSREEPRGAGGGGLRRRRPREFFFLAQHGALFPSNHSLSQSVQRTHIFILLAPSFPPRNRIFHAYVLHIPGQVSAGVAAVGTRAHARTPTRSTLRFLPPFLLHYIRLGVSTLTRGRRHRRAAARLN